MLRFQVFVFDTYYPLGGMLDWIGETAYKAESIAMCKKEMQDTGKDTWQVWDMYDDITIQGKLNQL